VARLDGGLGTGVEEIRSELHALGDELLDLEALHEADILGAHPAHRADAINLVHYVALRHRDMRDLQRRLAMRGLSSLGRCEPHVLASVEAVRRALDGDLSFDERADREDPLGFDAGRSGLDRNTDAVFGPRPAGRVTRIMVTMPTEAADDPALVREFVGRGMDVARINGAHDGPDAWRRMAANVRAACVETGRSCRIMMDLAGPKLRTGPLMPGPEVLRCKPERDARGVVTAPGRISFEAVGAPIRTDRSVPVDAAWLSRRSVGDLLEFEDARGAIRSLRVVSAGPEAITTQGRRTTYVERGTKIDCAGDGTVVGDMPALAQWHLLGPGDTLVCTRSLAPAAPWRPGTHGTASIGCTLPEAFESVRVGHRVLLDDGKICGIVERTALDEFTVRVKTTGPNGSRLRAEKGINLPDTDLSVPAVSDADRNVIRVAAQVADMVALSFVRHEDDVDELRRQLDEVGGGHLGIVLKIETTSAFEHLPPIVLRAMRSPLVAVMIARGDLAVEAGYGRLAEVQEQIMWLCEAARLPVIWATEVLDRLAKTGKPSRAEITDAAMAQRAECVMLNKGPHVTEAIDALVEIVARMSGHQRKKTSLLRLLRSWE
jgi:pyruvate kinase